MKKAFIVSVVMILCLVSSVCYALSTDEVKFTLDQFKMKVGSTQSLGAIISGKDVEYTKITSSNESVVKILDHYTLKAVSTGIATLTYPQRDDKGKDTSLHCYIEVTRDYNTFDKVSSNTGSIVDVYLVLDGVTTKIDCPKSAIPSIPEFTKAGYELDGWYLDEAYTTKLGKDQRLTKDTYLYARWLTPDEAEANKPVAVPMYEDVVNHWARNAIESVSYLGMFKGVSETRFGPENPMTRAMTIAAIGRLENNFEDGSKQFAYSIDANDVNLTSYYAPYLAWAIENKIVPDPKGDSFRPDDTITREEVAIYMYNYIKFKGYDTNPKVQIQASFTDASALSAEGKEAADVLYILNIMQGNADGSFAPKSPLTRAQIAQIMYNFNNFKMKYKG